MLQEVEFMRGFGWHGLGWFGGWGGWIPMIISFVLLVVIIVALVLLFVWAVRRITRNGYRSQASMGQSSGQPTARDILQARYARGEITREEYQQILKDIS
jgi:putative membrane protein